MRTGTLAMRPRTQSSIAIGSDAGAWVLVNASPDVRQQINAFDAWHAGDSVRRTPFAGIVLVDSQIDHTAGLLILRESDVPLNVYCTESVHEDLVGGFPVFDLLAHYCGVTWHPVPVNGEPFAVKGLEGLRFTAVPLPGKAPPYSPRRTAPRVGDNIGLHVEDARSGGRLFYAPGLAQFEPQADRYMHEADCVLVDGTVWRDDELRAAGIAAKTATEMGHLPQSGNGGMLEWLQRVPNARRILIHINNTNPILDVNSAERETLRRAGVEVAEDALHVSL